MSFFSTRQVAAMLGVKTSYLSRAVWDNRFKVPEKGPGGAFLWTERDIERASWALRRRGIDDVLDKIKKNKLSDLTAVGV